MFDAVYARQSHFKKDSISIQTQIDMAKNFVRIPFVFIKILGILEKTQSGLPIRN